MKLEVTDIWSYAGSQKLVVVISCKGIAKPFRFNGHALDTATRAYDWFASRNNEFYWFASRNNEFYANTQAEELANEILVKMAEHEVGL